MKSVRKDSVETRRRLLDTAEKLFLKQGVENVTLIEVSRAAGQKNRGAAQYHFGGKVGLINAVLNKHSDMIAIKRKEMLDNLLTQKKEPTMRELIDAIVLPITEHVQLQPNGLTYLMLNRQVIVSKEHSLQRVNSMPDVLHLQRLISKAMPPHSREATQAKMILLRCMLFNGLANFYDMKQKTGINTFVETLCASIVAVLLEQP